MTGTTSSSSYTEAHKRYYNKNKKKIREKYRESKAEQNHRYYLLHREEILQKQKDQRKQRVREALYSQVIPD